MDALSDQYIWGAHESITVSSTAVGFTSTTRTPTTGDFKNMTARIAHCMVETDNIRYRVDGTNPTSTTGHLKYASSEFYIMGTTAIKKFRAIRTSTDATLKVNYGW